MKLVVGLGNPGRKYDATRHNVGYRVLAEVARKYAAGKVKAKFQGETIEADIQGVKTLLLSPHTYMNNSGMSVQAACSFFKLPLEDLLVVCDDFNLPLGKLRFRTQGSSGGQKGLADVTGRLGSEEISRLRIGVGLPPEDWDAADFVLSKFTTEEKDHIQKAIQQAALAVADWILHGTEYCMNQYN